MRLIDADAFIKEQCNSCDGDCEDIQCDCLNCDSSCRCDMIRELQEAPTISPDEARGVGKWIRIPGFHLDHEYYPARFQCDKCKHFVDSGDDRNYCPNCGAKMEVSDDA